jgi:hypothetical protein
MRKLLSSGAALLLVGWACLASAPATQAANPSPAITAPDRSYTGTNIPLVFANTDLITTNSDAISVTASADNCNPGGVQQDPDLTGCAAFKLTLNNSSAGSLSVVVTTPASNPTVTYPIAQGGAYVVMSTNGDGTGAIIQLDGTAQQINDALQTLIFTPAQDYHNANLSPDTLNLHLLDGNDPTSTADHDVALRVDGINQWPSLTVPPDQDVAAGSTTLLPDPAPSGNGDFTVSDPDAYRGEADDYMLVIMWTTCGQFTLRNGLSFTVDNNLKHLLTSQPLALNATLVDTIVGLLPSQIGSLDVSSSGDPTQPRTAFLGLAQLSDASLSDLNYDLSQVSFTAPATSGTCTLWTFVSDLGNNGLPLHWVSGSPGYEVPALGIALKSVTFKVGNGVTISVPKDVYVNGGDTATVPISISSAQHPAFTVDVASADGTALAGSDYTAPGATVDYPDSSAGPVNIQVPTANDPSFNGEKTMTVTISLPPNTPHGISVDETTTVHIKDVGPTTVKTTAKTTAKTTPTTPTTAKTTPTTPTTRRTTPTPPHHRSGHQPGRPERLEPTADAVQRDEFEPRDQFRPGQHLERAARGRHGRVPAVIDHRAEQPADHGVQLGDRPDHPDVPAW